MHTCKPFHDGPRRAPSGAAHGTADELPASMNTAPPKAIKSQPIHNENSVEAMRGSPLAERVLARQAELAGEMDKLEEGTPEYIAIDTALATLSQFIGGDLDNPSDVVAHDLNDWLERNKYLGLSVGRSKVRS
jgi:hypothetical protein